MCAREDVKNQSSQLQEVKSDLAALKDATKSLEDVTRGLEKKLDADRVLVVPLSYLSITSIRCSFSLNHLLPTLNTFGREIGRSGVLILGL